MSGARPGISLKSDCRVLTINPSRSRVRTRRRVCLHCGHEPSSAARYYPLLRMSPAGPSQTSRYTTSSRGRRRTGPCRPRGQPMTTCPASIQSSGTPTACAQQLLAAVRGPTGHTGAEPEGAGGEQEVLHRREDRAAEEELRGARVPLLGEQDRGELTGTIVELVGGAVRSGPPAVVVGALGGSCRTPALSLPWPVPPPGRLPPAGRGT